MKWLCAVLCILAVSFCHMRTVYGSHIPASLYDEYTVAPQAVCCSAGECRDCSAPNDQRYKAVVDEEIGICCDWDDKTGYTERNCIADEKVGHGCPFWWPL